MLLDGVPAPSLRQAVARAAPGARIELFPGIHEGPLESSQALEIVAAAGAGEGEVVIESRTPVVLRARAGADVRLTGLHVRATGARGAAGESALIVSAGGRLTLRDCRVSSRRSGALEVLGGEVEVTGGSLAAESWQTCVLLGQGATGRFTDVEVASQADPGSAVEAWQSTLVLTRCRLSAVGATLVAGPAARVEGEGCRLTGRTAVWVAGTDAELVLADSQVRESKVGARVQGKAVLRRCTLTRCELALLVQGQAADVTLTGCELLANGKDLVLEDARESQVHREDGEP